MHSVWDFCASVISVEYTVRQHAFCLILQTWLYSDIIVYLSQCVNIISVFWVSARTISYVFKWFSCHSWQVWNVMVQIRENVNTDTGHFYTLLDTI